MVVTGSAWAAMQKGEISKIRRCEKIKIGVVTTWFQCSHNLFMMSYEKEIRE